MFYGDTIQETRQLFFSSWNKFRNQQALSALEHEIAQVIQAHPEYHQFIENPEQYQDHTYYPELGETNPFLHMGLHLGIREQVSTDRPIGIAAIYQELLGKYKDALHVEHLMMEQLAECLWLAQKNNLPPDENVYLERLAEL